MDMRIPLTLDERDCETIATDAPDQIVTDKLGSYGAARRELGLSCHHEQGLRKGLVTFGDLATPCSAS
jgi:hypothetical protein